MSAGGAIGGEFLSQGLNALYSGLAMNQQYRHAKKMLRNQQKWSEYMRSTAYQATMEDMRKAGLNPILAAGAPRPGATPTMGTGMTATAPAGPFSAKKALAVKKELDILDKQKDLIGNQSDKADWESAVAKAESIIRGKQAEVAPEIAATIRHKERQESWLTDRYEHEARSAKAMAEMSELDRMILEMSLPKHAAQMNFDKSDWNKFMRYVEGTIGPISPLLNMFKFGVHKTDVDSPKIRKRTRSTHKEGDWTREFERYEY